MTVSQIYYSYIILYPLILIYSVVVTFTTDAKFLQYNIQMKGNIIFNSKSEDGIQRRFCLKLTWFTLFSLPPISTRSSKIDSICFPLEPFVMYCPFWVRQTCFSSLKTTRPVVERRMYSYDGLQPKVWAVSNNAIKRRISVMLEENQANQECKIFLALWRC